MFLYRLLQIIVFWQAITIWRRVKENTKLFKKMGCIWEKSKMNHLNQGRFKCIIVVLWGGICSSIFLNYQDRKPLKELANLYYNGLNTTCHKRCSISHKLACKRKENLFSKCYLKWQLPNLKTQMQSQLKDLTEWKDFTLNIPLWYEN